MFGRKQRALEETRKQVDYWSTLFSSSVKRRDDTEKEILELKVENAILKERLKKYPPENQEDQGKS